MFFSVYYHLKKKNHWVVIKSEWVLYQNTDFKEWACHVFCTTSFPSHSEVGSEQMGIPSIQCATSSPDAIKSHTMDLYADT